MCLRACTFVPGRRAEADLGIQTLHATVREALIYRLLARVALVTSAVTVTRVIGETRNTGAPVLAWLWLTEVGSLAAVAAFPAWHTLASVGSFLVYTRTWGRQMT